MLGMSCRICTQDKREENLENIMQIRKFAALLVSTLGGVMFWAGSAEADGSHGEGQGDQINNCTSFSLINLFGGPQVVCVNEQVSGGGGAQVNNCRAVTVLGIVDDLRILPVQLDGSSVRCVNIRHANRGEV
ncbi:hypothetical protein C1J01_16235 [Nonomuraea aridisoli]|uniref:Uncharacterized protein n=1 Tax=Nonomuraea aridisoli TaxID=2070368 RepID=A0A2W2EMN1_9ACTN|nr:hypothetical protein C1J01_16235 [Nonomuraea aridisoli]